MTLKSYVEGLVKFMEENPALCNKRVVFSVDEEGNAFMPVNRGPSSGWFDKEYAEFESDVSPANAVCIN